MKAVMYGAGNIGRGFVGALLSQSGYDVLFIDVAKPVVEALHARRNYPLRILDGETRQDAVISNVDAIDGNDTEAVARAIADATLDTASSGSPPVLWHYIAQPRPGAMFFTTGARPAPA